MFHSGIEIVPMTVVFGSCLELPLHALSLRIIQALHDAIRRLILAEGSKDPPHSGDFMMFQLCWA